MQDIHLALWRSFANFDGRCSLRTWVYRVAHNAAAAHVMRQHRMKKRKFVTSEITGISAGNIPMKIHRIKNVLGRRFNQGANHGK
jgi:RNA polymerase sigma-70 factor (ECF subfamily)